MDTSTALAVPSYANVFDSVLSFDEVRQRAPAVFASCAHERMSSKYAFIPTERVLAGLTQAGFVPVEARQTRTRSVSRLHARHVIRLRRRCETIQVKDAVPELLFLNSHDGTSAYQLRVGLYRAVCANGLIVSIGAFPTIRVSHRTDIIDELIAGALDLAERFENLTEQVDRMQRRLMFKDEQIRFAEHALALRFPDLTRSGLQPSQLLTCRRIEDTHDDLWSTLNKVQENLTQGGLSRRSLNGRLTRTRRITSIGEDVRLNSRLWDLATEVLAA